LALAPFVEDKDIFTNRMIDVSRTLACTLFAAALLAAPAAQAQTFQQGDIFVHLRAIGVLPENFSSSVSLIGGRVKTTDQPAPEVDLSYFLTNNVSVEAIAASTRHEVSATGTAVGKVDVGSVWALPPTVTLQYHTAPIAGFTPYAGVGLTVIFFYDSHPAGPTVTKVGYSTGFGPLLDAGFDYSLGGRWFANFDVKQMFVNTTAHINNSAITAKTSLSPTVVGAGIGYLF
jgi:outer membrane protein